METLTLDHAFPRQGEVWLAAMARPWAEPVEKKRPVLILQADVWNKYSPVVLGIPIATRRASGWRPTEIVLYPPEGGLVRQSILQVNLIQPIDKHRLIRVLGCVCTGTLTRVLSAFRAVHNIPDPL